MIWNKEKEDWLRKNYPTKGKMFCARHFNVKEGAIRQRAYKLNIKFDRDGEFFWDFQRRVAKSRIGKHYPNVSKAVREGYENGTRKKYHPTKKEKETHSIWMKKYIEKNGHPKGMLGKKHTKEVRRNMSIRSKKMWADPQSKCNSQSHKQKQSDIMTYRQLWKTSKHSNWKTHKIWCVVGGKKCFFLSRWEMLYASYLEYRKQSKEIKDWEYEVETFWFEEIRRGVRSYTPDFKVYTNDDMVEFHEVKGRWDAKSKTKRKRMNKYYKGVMMRYFDKENFFTKNTLSMLDVLAKKYVKEITQEEYAKKS